MATWRIIPCFYHFWLCNCYAQSDSTNHVRMCFWREKVLSVPWGCRIVENCELYIYYFFFLPKASKRQCPTPEPVGSNVFCFFFLFPNHSSECHAYWSILNTIITVCVSNTGCIKSQWFHLEKKSKRCKIFLFSVYICFGRLMLLVSMNCAEDLVWFSFVWSFELALLGSGTGTPTLPVWNEVSFLWSGHLWTTSIDTHTVFNL